MQQTTLQRLKWSRIYRQIPYCYQNKHWYLNQPNHWPDLCPSRTWGIITAYNPAGVVVSAAQNAQAHQKLGLELCAYPHELGHNGQGDWQELGFWVWDIRLTELLILGQRYGQAAVIWGHGRSKALVWCLDMHIERL